MKTTTIPTFPSDVGLDHPTVQRIMGDSLVTMPADLRAEIERGHLWVVSDARPYGHVPADDTKPAHRLVVSETEPVEDGSSVAKVVGLR